jgi:hypothetical protein
VVSEVQYDKLAQIRALYKTDRTIKALFDWAAGRDRDAKETSIDRLVEKIQVAKPQVIQACKQLHDVGCGRFMYGRRGAKTRMRWFYSLRSLGKAAKGDTSHLDEINDELDEDDGSAGPVLQAKAGEDTAGRGPSERIEHRFALRPSISVTISLPGDLTRKEAERFAAFIQSLPFES